MALRGRTYFFVVAAGCVSAAACTLFTDLDGFTGGGELDDAGGPEASSDVDLAEGGADAEAGVRVTCSSPGLQAGAPWPTLGGCSDRNGRSAFVGTSTPAEKWRLPTSDGGVDFYVTGVLIDRDDNLYFGDDTGLVSATREGALRWRSQIGDVTFGGAIAADGTIIVSTNTGPNELNAIFPDGGIRWRITTDQDDMVPSIADDGQIYFAARTDRAYVVDPNGGALRDFIETDAAAHRTAIGNGRVYFSTRYNGVVYAMHPDASAIWRASAPDAVDVTVASDGTVYAGTDNSRLYAIGADGGIKWTFEPSGGPASVHPANASIGADGTIFYAANDGVRALSTSGAQEWLFPLQNRPGGVTLDAEDNLYFCAGQPGQTTEVISLRRGGGLRWRFPVSAACDMGQPTLGRDGTVYVVLRAQSTLLAIGSP